MTRKIIALVLLSVTMISIFGANILAHEEYIYTYGDMTVSFDYDVPFNEEQRQAIASSMFGIEEEPPIIAPLAACSHTYTTGTVTSTSHKVNSSAPRCVENKYSVSVCSKCSYIASQTLTSSRAIHCCS